MIQHKWAKAIVATLVSIGAVLVTALGTSPQGSFSHWGAEAWLTTIGAILGSGGITWWTTNVPGSFGGAIKAVLAGASAFVTVLIASYADNMITQAEWITAFTALIIGLSSVYEIPNKGAADG